MELLGHILFNRLLKICLIFGFALFHTVSSSQVQEYESYRKKLSELSGKEKLAYYSEVIKKLEGNSVVLSERILQDAIEDSKAQNDSLRLIRFHRSMGGVQHRLSQYESSSTHFYRSIEYAREFGDEVELNKSKVSMTSVYLYNREYDRGITNLKEAIDFLKNRDENEVLGIAYSNLANLYREKGEFDLAIAFGKEAIKIQLKTKDKRHLAISYANLGSVYSYQNRFKEGLVYLDKANEVLTSLNSRMELTFLYLEYSKVHQKQEAYSQAGIYANLALELARNEKSLDFQARALNQLALIDYEQRKFETSIEYLIQQMVLQGDINKDLQSKKVRETSAVYSVYEAERRSVKLKHQVTLEKNRFKLMLIVAIAVSLLFVLMIIMWARIRAKNRVLFEQSIKRMPPTLEKVKVELEDDSEKYEKLYKDILVQFEEKKVYLDSTLTMGMLSDVVRSNSNYVSKSINVYFGSNFNSMINFYRVNEAKVLIENGALATYTMETIAAKCGFTSLSVFNRSFKKETGITPTYFNKSLIAGSNSK